MAAPRQVLPPVSAKQRRYQDFDSMDSLDVDSMDELDGKYNKYADLLTGDAAAAAAAAAQGGAAATGTHNGAARSGTAAPRAAAYGGAAASAPPAPSRAPAQFSSFDDSFGFDDEWGLPAGGGGYMNGGGGGGYSNGGGGGGYMNGGGGYMNGGGGGYMSGSGYNGGGYLSGYGGYSGGGGYISTTQRRNGGRLGGRGGRLADDLDEVTEEAEVPVVKVDSCVINGKKLQANHGITVRQVFLLGAGPDRVPLGTMPTSRAQELADEAKEDLLLINPDASPPVARIIKWSKYKFELEKGAKNKKAKSATQETKEVRLRPSTDTGDIATKLKSCSKFLQKGDRVKLVMKFEGRELQYKEQGKEVLLNFISELASVAKVEGPLNFKTGTYIIMLAPNKATA